MAIGNVDYLGEDAVRFCSDDKVLQSEYAKKKLSLIYSSVINAKVPEMLDGGWVPFKEGKTRTRFQQPKSVQQQLADDVWCLMHRMGYRTLNIGKFQVHYEPHGENVRTIELSVVAEDDETVVVVECRFREERGRKSFQKDIAETKRARIALQRELKRRHGATNKHKILWLYATRNVIWSSNDVEQASEAGIKIVTENEFQYFDSFIRHLGPAGRFQFLAEFFSGQDIPGLDDVRIPATQGVFGKKKFYSFVTTPRRLLKIAFVNHQALNHPDGHPAYQRMISASRITDIQKFIQEGGFFPTNILINFNKVCRFDLLPKETTDHQTKFGWLYLPRQYKSAWIIDGQHRLYGYSHLSGKYLDQPIAVIAFELLPPNEEAGLFITINHEQKSVPKSILVALQADLKINSTVPKEKLGALASAVAKATSGDSASPFFQRFAVQGMLSVDAQSLTIPEVVNGLVRAGLLGRVIQGNHIPGPLSGATDKATILRAQKVVELYFHLVRDANPRRWDSGREGCISTNPGVRAHMLLLAECCNYQQTIQGQDPSLLTEEKLVQVVTELINPVLKFIREQDDAEIRLKFSRKFGEGGVREYFENLADLVCTQCPEFGTEQLRSNLALKKDQRRHTADADVIKISKDILDVVVTVLKREYGDGIGSTGDANYWGLGIESANIKTSAYERQLQDKTPQPKEAYLGIIALKTIVRQKSNWLHFQGLFNIPLPGERGKTYYLDWMDRFNEVRRIPAHPSGGRTYSEEDYELLKHIKLHFYLNRDQYLTSLRP